MNNIITMKTDISDSGVLREDILMYEVFFIF